MAKGDQIPTTAFVPPWTDFMPAEQLNRWFRALASFVSGFQAVKDFNGIQSIRMGQLVHIQGTVTIPPDTSTLDILAISPRAPGFLTACATDGTLKGMTITKGSTQVNANGLGTGVYTIWGSYLALPKET